MRASLFFLLCLFMISPAACAQQGISCLEWCRKCDAGPGCTTNCLLEDQPMHDPSCDLKTKTTKTRGVTCHVWCKKCKPNDTACHDRCDNQGNPVMLRGCPTQYGPDPADDGNPFRSRTPGQ